MRFDVLAREVGGEMVEPPRAAAHAMAARGANFGAVQQVALTDDAHEAAVRIDHRGAADATFREQRGQALDRCFRINRDHVGRHHVHRAHCAPPNCSSHSRSLGLWRDFGDF
jgi:hypothetical protein